MIYLHYQLLGGSSSGINSPCDNDVVYNKAHHGGCSDDKRNLLFSANDFQQTMCMFIVRDMIYISCSMMKADCKMTLIDPAFGRVQCGCDTQT